MNTLDFILASLALTAISSLAIIAYRHPSSYEKLYVPLLFIVGAATLVLVAYNGGVLAAYLELDDLVPVEHKGQALAIRESLSYDDLMILVAWGIGYMYLIFLALLPYIGITSRSEGKSKD